MFSDQQWDALTKTEFVKTEFSEHCVKMLNRLVEELPLERWVEEAVERGEVSSNLLKDLFGSGEGRGWDETQGLTIEEALRSWYVCDQIVDKIVQQAREDSDEDLSQDQA